MAETGRQPKDPHRQRTTLMDILIKVLQFILSFSLLVIIHELGHFLFARIFGVRVEQFQLFFGRPIASFTRRGTRYGIGWIPFGGYVKLAGMIDESMDTEQMKSEPKPDEFRSKPAWQRLPIMVGGVLMNILLALVIYIGISWKWGESYLSTRDMTYGYVFSTAARTELYGRGAPRRRYGNVPDTGGFGERPRTGCRFHLAALSLPHRTGGRRKRCGRGRTAAGRPPRRTQRRTARLFRPIHRTAPAA